MTRLKSRPAIAVFLPAILAAAGALAKPAGQ
jgi:hypothetical protein